MQGSITYDAYNRPVYQGSGIAEKLWNRLGQEERAIVARHNDLILLLEDEAGQIERGIETEEVALDTITMLAKEARGLYSE